MMNRMTLFAAALVGSFSLPFGVVQAADQAPTTAPTTRQSGNMIRTRASAVLDRTLPDIRLNMNAFKDVVDFLRDSTGMNVVVDWRALERVGINNDAPVTMNLHNAKVSTILKLLLIQLSTPETSVVYTVDDDVVLITTKENPAAQQARAVNAQTRMEVVKNLRDACVDPDAMIVVALGSLRSESGLTRDAFIQILNDELKRPLDSAAQLSSRNAIRLTLKDLYLDANDTDNERRVLLDMIRDNGKEPRAAYVPGAHTVGAPAQP